MALDLPPDFFHGLFEGPRPKKTPAPVSRRDAPPALAPDRIEKKRITLRELEASAGKREGDPNFVPLTETQPDLDRPLPIETFRTSLPECAADALEHYLDTMLIYWEYEDRASRVEKLRDFLVPRLDAARITALPIAMESELSARLETFYFNALTFVRDVNQGRISPTDTTYRLRVLRAYLEQMGSEAP